jgi:hypothetical protein
VSGSVICHGCGQRLAIPPGYQRRKMRCPQCGVICELPDPAAARPASRTGSRPAPGPDEAAEEFLLRGQEVPTCPRCGADLEDGPGGQGRCPSCEPTDGIRATDDLVGLLPESRPVAPEPVTSEEVAAEDADSYGVVGDLEPPKCPGCGRSLAPEDPVCVACGFNRATGKKPPRVYEPIERHWEAGMAFRTRVLVFVALDAVIVGSLVLLSFATGVDVPLFAISWVVGTVLLAFLLGTYDRVDLTRNKKGKVHLSKTWRICFVPREPTLIRVRDYEGIATGMTRDVNFLDWLICLIVLPAGIVPAIIWWWYAIYHDSYQAALMRDHGYPEVVLYRGWNEVHMRDIAQTVSEVLELPWDGR